MLRSPPRGGHSHPRELPCRQRSPPAGLARNRDRNAVVPHAGELEIVGRSEWSRRRCTGFAQGFVNQRPQGVQGNRFLEDLNLRVWGNLGSESFQIRGHVDDPGAQPTSGHLAHQLKARATWKIDVREDQIRGFRVDKLESLIEISRVSHVEARELGEPPGQRSPKDGFVLDDQDRGQRPFLRQGP